MYVVRYYDGVPRRVSSAKVALDLFQALVDLPSGLGLWAYTLIDDDEAQAIAGAEDADAADDLMNDIADTRPGQLAVAVDGHVAFVTETDGTTRNR